jgi:hypothetical protein
VTQVADVQMLVHWRIAAGGRAFDSLLMAFGSVFLGELPSRPLTSGDCVKCG